MFELVHPAIFKGYIYMLPLLRLQIKNLGICCLVSSFLLNAEPSATSAYLMDEPATLLDLGIVSLRSDIKNLFKTDSTSNYFTSVSYVWEEDAIEIFVYIASACDSRAQAQRKVEQAINEILADAGWFLEKKHPGLYKNGSIYSELFIHEGFKRTNQPENLGKKIDNLIEIGAVSSFIENNKAKTITGKCSFRNQEIFYSVK